MQDVFKKKIMKKISFLRSFILGMSLLLVACEEAPLDRNITPKSELASFIKVEVPEVSNTDPEDDSGLPALPGVFIGEEVSISSSTNNEDVLERKWYIPQPSSEEEEQNITIFNTLDDVKVSFARASSSKSVNETSGFTIVLFETLNNGETNRYATSVLVRSKVKAAIQASGTATIGIPTKISAGSIEDLGLEVNDVAAVGQTTLIWNFGKGVLVTEDGSIVNSVETNIVDAEFGVVFNELGEQDITLTVQRNWPVKSTNTIEVKINVIEFLTPNGGLKDPIKLSADGSKITIRFAQEIADISLAKPGDFGLTINAPVGIVAPSIDIASVALEVGDESNIVLSLSSDIPGYLMDDILLTFDNESKINKITTKEGAILGDLNNKVFPTGKNLLENINASSFESSTVWTDGGFFFPNPADTPEMSFSTERSLVGSSSLLFETTGTPLSSIANNFGIGASVVENGPFVLPVTSGANYVVSMWVYVETTEPDTSVNFFLLDFGPNAGVVASDITLGKWKKVSIVRNIAPDGDLRSLIRVLNPTNSTTSNSKIFVDYAEIRIVDDGK